MDVRKLLLVTILLCIVFCGSAKKNIRLNAQTRVPTLSIRACIDEESKELTLDLGEYQKNVKVVIADLSGNNIFNAEISMNNICILPLPSMVKGKYFLSLFIEDVELYGFFDINNY